MADNPQIAKESPAAPAGYADLVCAFAETWPNKQTVQQVVAPGRFR